MEIFQKPLSDCNIFLLTGQHVDISTIRNGENVRGHFITPPTTVHLGATQGVYGEALVGVDGDAEKAGIGLQGGI